MAIYHLSAQIIGRSEGRSSVAAAAYRAKEKIMDERTGLAHDYTKRNMEIEAEILAPSNLPDWVYERQKLWNEVENIEKRKDAQLAREINIALPKELSKEQNRELIKEYAIESFVTRGMIADISIHWDKDNPHAHIMLTTREITQNGFEKKNREWNNKELLESWRESWARSANQALSQANIHEHISHKTLKEQGIDREPQIHLGPAVIAMEKRGIDTERGEVYRQIEDINKKIIEIEDYKKQKEELIRADRNLGLDYELNEEERSFLEPIRDLLDEVKLSKSEVISEIERVNKLKGSANDKLWEITKNLNSKVHLRKQIEKLENIKRDIKSYSLGRKILNWKSYKELKESAKEQKNHVKTLSKKLIIPSLYKVSEEINKIEGEKSEIQIELEKVKSKEELLNKAVKTMEEAERRYILKDYPEEIRSLSYKGALRLREYALSRGGIVDYKDVYKHYDQMVRKNEDFKAEIKDIKTKETNIKGAEETLDRYLKDKRELQKLENAIFRFGKKYKDSLEQARQHYRYIEDRYNYYQRELGEEFLTKKDLKSISDIHENEVKRIPEIRKSMEIMGRAITFMENLIKDINKCTNEPYRTLDKIIERAEERLKEKQITENRLEHKERNRNRERGR